MVKLNPKGVGKLVEKTSIIIVSNLLDLLGHLFHIFLYKVLKKLLLIFWLLLFLLLFFSYLF